MTLTGIEHATLDTRANQSQKDLERPAKEGHVTFSVSQTERNTNERVIQTIHVSWIRTRPTLCINIHLLHKRIAQGAAFVHSLACHSRKSTVFI